MQWARATRAAGETAVTVQLRATPQAERPLMASVAHWLEGGPSARAKKRLQALYGPAAGVGMSVTASMEQTRRAFQHAYSPGYVAAWRRAARYYVAFCARIGASPYPVRAENLMMFLCDRVVRLKLEPSGLGSLLTSLRSSVELQRLGWSLDSLDDRVLSMVRRGLAKEYKGQNSRGAKEPFRLSHIDTCLSHSSRGCWAPRLQQAMLQAQLAHGGMLRTAEHTAGKLLVKDVEFLVSDGVGGARTVQFHLGRPDLVGVRLTLRDAKTGHVSAKAQFALIGRRVDHMDVVGPLWDYFQAHGLYQGGHDAEPLFCELSPDGRRLATMSVSGGAFRRSLSEVLTLSGISAEGFGGHSPRRGGCNDLFDAGVPLDMVMKAGRWKSIVWMAYRELSPAAMRLMASVPAQRGVHPLGVFGPRLLSCLKAASQPEC